MRPVAERLSELISADVQLAPEVVGERAAAMSRALEPGEVLLLENSRFEPGETANDPALAAALAALAEVYVNDAFGAAHRAHATTEGVAHRLPAYAGLLLERELEQLGRVVADPERPLVVVLGGAKVSDKVGVIDRFLEIADVILIGGAMCFSFFRAQGVSTGDSLVEEEGVELAAKALENAEGSDCDLRLPVDLVLGDRFEAEAERRVAEGTEVPEGWMGLDIGPRTAREYAAEVSAAGTVLWNGPMGAFELEPFADGTRVLAEAVAGTGATTVVGGGDSVAALRQFGLADQVDWLSTGGGASLELLEGKRLPGVEALRGREAAAQGGGGG
jgi:phosphoglycerate kinase